MDLSDLVSHTRSTDALQVVERGDVVHRTRQRRHVGRVQVVRIRGQIEAPPLVFHGRDVRGEPAFGLSVMIPSPQIVESASGMGFDWVWVITRALARYVANNDREASRILGEYIDANQHRVTSYRRRASDRLCVMCSVVTPVVSFEDLTYGAGSEAIVRADGNALRVLGRWMRMVTIPNQSSVAKAFNEFDEAGRMRPSPYYNRIVDVMEELVKFTHLTRGRSAYLTDRYSERMESAEAVSRRVNQRSI